MQELEQMDIQAASDCRLAWLLTGDREISANATLEALDTSNPAWSFAAWMSAWSRRVVIARGLTAIRAELAESARRTASAHIKNRKLHPRNVRPGDGPLPFSSSAPC